ncbi:hypothetical protein O9H85_26350 [Paenibacillus filicis]|uniref:Uncharacterized protein n=1 Tax=Paenibacillus gyeongsangnamensis TaxID=3388067 RepID=A0ABT4QG42_9BACL|nr:hypothetical protein [Paenibacillus filicis]MCZ8515854.1 hypothetical protein [Paenibacillus filicis]
MTNPFSAASEAYENVVKRLSTGFRPDFSILQEAGANAVWTLFEFCRTAECELPKWISLLPQCRTCCSRQDVVTGEGRLIW